MDTPSVLSSFNISINVKSPLVAYASGKFIKS